MAFATLQDSSCEPLQGLAFGLAFSIFATNSLLVNLAMSLRVMPMKIPRNFVVLTGSCDWTDSSAFGALGALAGGAGTRGASEICGLFASAATGVAASATWGGLTGPGP